MTGFLFGGGAGTTVTATGSTAARSLSDRFADYINVKDFGAIGDGSHDDTTNIQAAINANINVAGNTAALGTIYIPRGTYKVTSPLYLPPGRGGTATVTTVTFDIASPGTVNWTAHGLAVNTPVTFGTLGDTLPTGLAQGATYYVKTVNSANQFTVSATAGGAAINFTGSTSGTQYGSTSTALGTNQFRIVGDGPGATIITGNVAGFIFDSANIITSAARAFSYLMEDVSVTNTNTTAISTGCIRCAGMFGASFQRIIASGMVGFTTEDTPGNIFNGSQCYTFENCYCPGGVGTIGFVVTGDSHVLKGCDVSGSHIGATLAGTGHQLLGCHFEVNTTAVAVGIFGDTTTVAYLRGFLISAGAYEGNGTAIDLISGCGYGLIQGVVIQGEATSIEGSASTSAYGIRFRDGKATFCTVLGAQIGGDCTVAGIYLGETTGNVVRAGNVIQAVQSVLVGGALGSAWVFPTAAQSAAGYIFIGNNSQPAWAFAQLPTTTNRVAGDTYFISDANTSTLGNSVTASGATPGTVIFNGTNWTLASK